jgi:hypothetical protein
LLSRICERVWSSSSPKRSVEVSAFGDEVNLGFFVGEVVAGISLMCWTWASRAVFFAFQFLVCCKQEIDLRMEGIKVFNDLVELVIEFLLPLFEVVI